MNKLTLLNFFTVLKCPSCDEVLRLGREGDGVLCDKCKSKFETEKQRSCSVCGLPAELCRCIPKNIRSAGCRAFIKIALYDPSNEGVTERIILYQKDHPNKRLSDFFAAQMTVPLRACLVNLKTNIPDVIVTYAPRSRKAVNEKGFDQAEVLARLCAERIGCRFMKLIKRTSGGKQQKELDGSERIENAKRSFELKNVQLEKKSTVVIVDDIVTSGASLATCANLLQKSGAEHVICLSIAQTNKIKR